MPEMWLRLLCQAGQHCGQWVFCLLIACWQVLLVFFSLLEDDRFHDKPYIISYTLISSSKIPGWEKPLQSCMEILLIISAMLLAN